MFLDKIKNKIENNEKNKIVEKYDVVIIGGGQTGLVLAKQLIKKEIKTLVIDKGDLGIKTSLDLRNFIKLIQRIISKNKKIRTHTSLVLVISRPNIQKY